MSINKLLFAFKINFLGMVFVIFKRNFNNFRKFNRDYLLCAKKKLLNSDEIMNHWIPSLVRILLR